MSFEADEEILQDFLIEAGEILELLSEQLVELENDSANTELVNAIFRGFHTIKGGAGFLALNELVDVCHGAENIFDILRSGKREVTSDLMDVILQALDSINEMFVLLKNKELLIAPDSHLLAQLNRLSVPQSEDVISVETASASARPAGENLVTDENMSEDEFERLLDELHHTSPADTLELTPPTDLLVTNDSNDISDDEFESLLDELHGNGSFSAELNDSADSPNISISSSNAMFDDEFESLLDELHGQGTFNVGFSGSTEISNSLMANSDVISDDEFDSLLDELHGKGNGPKKSAAIDSSLKNQSVHSVGVSAPEVKGSVKPVIKKVPESPVIQPVASTITKAETTLRVDTKRLDQIMNMVGELVLVRNRLASLGLSTQDEELTKAITNLDAVTTDLQGAVMKTRMQPIKKVFGRFPRVVRDLARSLNKEIKLVLEGEETDLDKNLVEALADPLVHLVRNSVDHGIEEPDVRESQGKPREGTVLLSASQEGDHILLTIKDDGAGMNAEKLKNIAIDRGVIDVEAAAKMSDKEAFSLIFAPGFSTKTEISEVSGRGVGMDVVKTKITQLNGTVNIDSEIGVGTVLEIKVPLTLAILTTLMVVVGKQIFALPLTGVNEIFHFDLTKTNTVDGQLTIIVREKAIPLFYLDQWLVRDYKPKERDRGHVVIVQLGNKKVGFVVDSLIGQEEVVIKPLDKLLHGTPGMAGATITSDGGIALILDVPHMLKYYAKKAVIHKKFH